jgi:hypothetical protein
VADLSPAAQAIFDAAWGDTGIILGDHEGTLRAQLAAALRAAADQVVPDEPDYMRAAIPARGWWDKHDLIRSELLAIAAELEAP